MTGGGKPAAAAQSAYRLGAVVRAHAPALAAGAALVAGTVAVQLGLPFIVRRIVDALAEGTLTRTALARGVGLYAALLLPAAVVSYWMRRLPLSTAHAIEYRLRRDLFAHLVRLDQGFARRQRIGDLMTRMSSDLTVVRDALGHGLLHSTRAVVALVLGCAVLLRLHAGLAWTLLAMWIGMTLSCFGLMGLIRRRHRRLQERVSDLGHTVEETVAGIRTIKGYALEDQRRARFAAENRGLLRRAMALSYASEPIWPLFAGWFSAQMVFVLVYGGRLVLRDALSLGDLVLVTQYLLFMQWPLLSLGWIAGLLQRSRTSWARVREILDTRPAIADGPATDPTVATLRGDLAFRGVRLRIDGRPVLDGIDLDIPAGTSLGITGPTGSGKTLLVSLVARLLDPDEGEVRIDGRPLPCIPLDVLRRHVGMAQQEPVLFSDTLLRNLGFGLDRDAEDVVHWAAHVAHLEADIERFPERYATRVGERGVTLSGGQRQRASLGRALARRPAILVLDDVLASVDTQTEAAILGKLAPVVRRRTTLLVSHRLSTLHWADRIVVLDAGRIVQQGTHAELAACPGYYADTLRLQQLEAGAGAGEEGSDA